MDGCSGRGDKLPRETIQMPAHPPTNARNIDLFSEKEKPSGNFALTKTHSQTLDIHSEYSILRDALKKNLRDYLGIFPKWMLNSFEVREEVVVRF